MNFTRSACKLQLRSQYPFYYHLTNQLVELRGSRHDDEPAQFAKEMSSGQCLNTMPTNPGLLHMTMNIEHHLRQSQLLVLLVPLVPRKKRWPTQNNMRIPARAFWKSKQHRLLHQAGGILPGQLLVVMQCGTKPGSCGTDTNL